MIDLHCRYNFLLSKFLTVIADCGGLLGLFLRFSFTALITFIRSLIEGYKKRLKTLKAAAVAFQRNREKKNKIEDLDIKVIEMENYDLHEVKESKTLRSSDKKYKRRGSTI